MEVSSAMIVGVPLAELAPAAASVSCWNSCFASAQEPADTEVVTEACVRVLGTA